MMFTRAQVRKQKSNGTNNSGGSNQRARPTRNQQQKQQEQQYLYDVIFEIHIRLCLCFESKSLMIFYYLLILDVFLESLQVIELSRGHQQRITGGIGCQHQYYQHQQQCHTLSRT